MSLIAARDCRICAISLNRHLTTLNRAVDTYEQARGLVASACVTDAAEYEHLVALMKGSEAEMLVSARLFEDMLQKEMSKVILLHTSTVCVCYHPHHCFDDR